MLLLLYSG
jgi:hypothetical protein